MSLKIVHCRNCNTDTIPVGATSVWIQFSKSTWCEQCNHSHKDEISIYFCSSKCMVNFIDNKMPEFDKELKEFEEKK